tara:strand:- start:1994 stop:2386 length:393 start_codon:yes stop_codon:yes gene_type:complete
MKRSPMKQKRDKPRRNEGRIQHKRMKPKARRPATKEEDAHIDRLCKLPCIVPGCFAAPVYHHIMHMNGKDCRRDHRYGANLCPDHHNMGNQSVHLLGGEKAFLTHHGVDLVKYAIEQWAISQKLWERENG